MYMYQFTHNLAVWPSGRRKAITGNEMGLQHIVFHVMDIILHAATNHAQKPSIGSPWIPGLPSYGAGSQATVTCAPHAASVLDGPIREQLVSDAGPLHSIVFHWVIERLSSSRLHEHERVASELRIVTWYMWRWARLIARNSILEENKSFGGHWTTFREEITSTFVLLFSCIQADAAVFCHGCSTRQYDRGFLHSN